MFKIIPLISIVMILITCSSNQDTVERIMENGVEVVINHLEPYKTEDLASTLTLEQEMVIDTEKDKIAETGLVDMETFAVDDEENIYIIRRTSNENFVYKFDNKGRYVKSFVRRGQGPGEIEWGGSVRYVGDNKLKIKDPGRTKYSVYTTEGEFLEEELLKTHISILKEFSNGKLFVFWQDNSPNMDKHINHLGVADFGLENIQEIYTYSFPNVMVVEKVYAPGNFWIEGASESQIYIGDGKLGYEIMVFDLEGNLVRKIRKDHDPVELTEEYKSNFFERRKNSPVLDKYELRKHFPPFQYLFTDEEGRIFVMTYEKGQSANEWVSDIFTVEGVFVGRIPIKSRIESRQIAIEAKHNRLYSICEKESGYKELVVYSMKLGRRDLD
ncbi:MAG: 6-bladed beta-propeller [Candidatus Aminicenantes bacterium]|nr:MAG: 6-bladed beta-propeller [Candidatus Aminicenantes bacterium]